MIQPNIHTHTIVPSNFALRKARLNFFSVQDHYDPHEPMGSGLNRRRSQFTRLGKQKCAEKADREDNTGQKSEVVENTRRPSESIRGLH